MFTKLHFFFNGLKEAFQSDHLNGTYLSELCYGLNFVISKSKHGSPNIPCDCVKNRTFQEVIKVQ